MRKILILFMAGILIASFNPYVKTWGDCYYEWRLDTDSAGRVHIEVDIHLRKVDFSLTSWDLAFDMKWYEKIEDMKAYETGTQKEMEIEVQKTSKTLRYFYIFEETLKSQDDLDFTVEFDLNDAFVEPIEGVDYFEWSVSTSENFMRHEMDVSLPRGTEVLFITEAAPLEFTGKKSEQIHFVEEPEGGIKAIVMGLAFSGAGISSLEKAEAALSAEKYEEALSHYENAYVFYESLSTLYGATRDEFFSGLSQDPEEPLTPTYLRFSTTSDYGQFLSELREKKASCQEKIEEAELREKETEADTVFSDAQDLFENGDYEAAQNAFEKAQALYAALNDDKKVSECQDYIDQCIQLLKEKKKKAEADTFFEEGISLFEQQQYEEAKSKFEKALNLYQEIGDTEMSQECEQWIASCEENLEEGGFCCGTGLLLFMVVAGVYCSLQKRF